MRLPRCRQLVYAVLVCMIGGVGLLNLRLLNTRFRDDLKMLLTPLDDIDVSDVERVESTPSISTTTTLPRDASWLIMQHHGGMRLGNVMFVYATLLGMADRSRKQPVFVKHPFIGNYFSHLSLPMNYTDRQIDALNMTITKHREMDCCKFTDWLLNNLTFGRSYALSGYYQSWKYFEHVAHRLRKHEFVWSEEIRQKCDAAIDKVLGKRSRADCQLVGAHMRRGDFAFANNPYVPGKASYLRRAIDWFKTRLKGSHCVHFLIVGDDHRWNLQHAPADPTVHVLRNSHAPVDMCILSSSNHTIVSTGTFGWWGAYLANGTTVYQKEFAAPGSHLWRQYKIEDFFPPHWISL